MKADYASTSKIKPWVWTSMHLTASIDCLAIRHNIQLTTSRVLMITVVSVMRCNGPFPGDCGGIPPAASPVFYTVSAERDHSWTHRHPSMTDATVPLKEPGYISYLNKKVLRLPPAPYPVCGMSCLGQAGVGWGSTLSSS